MNQNKIIGIGLALLNTILLLFCIVRYMQADRTAPKFLLEATDIIYSPDMDTTELVQGITANDNRDGDVTDRIVIEKITEKKKEQTAVVYYAVSDRSGNVTKISKLFHAKYPEPETVQEAVDIQGTVIGQTEAGLQEDAAKESDAEEGSAEETVDEAADSQDAAGDDEEEQAEEEAEAEEAVSPVGNDTQPDEAQQPAEAENTESVNIGAPELVLGRSEITIDAGTNPPWTEIIETMRDDKDNYETLYYNLKVSQFNRNRPGTYPVTVYVEDSDGNRSQEVPFTIIVR